MQCDTILFCGGVSLSRKGEYVTEGTTMDATQQEAVLRHPNITIEANRVTVTSPFYWLKGIIAIGVYCVFMYALLDEGAARILSPGFAIAFLIATALMVWYVARQKTVAVFDGFEKRLYRRNMLYTMNEADFSDIAEVVSISESGTGGSGIHFKVAFKEDRLGKGLPVTQSYRESDEEFQYFVEFALPAINAMLAEAEGAGAERTAAAVSLDNPTFYTKEGARYVRRRWAPVLATIAVGAFVFVIGAAKGEAVLYGAGIVAMLFSLLIIHTITFDIERKTITFGRAFGKWNSVFSMDRYTGIQVTRTHTNSIYTGTTAAMLFENPEKTVDLARGYFTRKLSVLVEESKAIIAAATKNDQNGDTE